MRTSIREFAKAIATVKNLTAKVTDGNVIGIDTVSGGTYFAGMPCIGTVIKTPSGVHKLVVDAIAYGRDAADKYKSENRLVLVEFDPETLMIGHNAKRTNIGYTTLSKSSYKNLGTVFAFIDAWDNDAVRRAEAAKKAAEAKRRKEAAAQKAIFSRFI